MSAGLIPYRRTVATEGPSNRDAAALIFDPDWYRVEYPDVAISGIDPALHYFANGAAEGRKPNPYFDTCWYISTYADVRASGMNPFMHFLLYGFREGRVPCANAETGSIKVAARSKRAARGRAHVGNAAAVSTAMGL